MAKSNDFCLAQTGCQDLEAAENPQETTRRDRGMSRTDVVRTTAAIATLLTQQQMLYWNSLAAGGASLNSATGRGRLLPLGLDLG